LAAEIGALKGDRSLPWRNDSHDAPEGRGLARPVASQEGDQLSLFYFGRDALEDMALAIIGVDILKTEHLSRLPDKPPAPFDCW
jgi:hypothetical protein